MNKKTVLGLVGGLLTVGLGALGAKKLIDKKNDDYEGECVPCCPVEEEPEKEDVEA